MLKGEKTRSAILQAAYQLFLDQGYHGTSMRQIAQKSDLALGGIYNHFAGKEEIFLTVLEDHHPYHEILPILQNARGETVEAFVLNAAQGMVAALEQRPAFLNLMLIEIVEFNSRHLPHMINTFFPQIKNVIQQFADRQEKLRPIPVPMIIRTFVGLVFSYYITERLASGEFPVELQEGALGYAMDIFLHGIVAEGEAA